MKKARGYFLGLLLVIAALLIPSSVEVRPPVIQRCHMCHAVRTEENRTVESLLPVFNKHTVVVEGGKSNCQHWWRDENSAGWGGGFSFKIPVIVSRILLLVLAVWVVCVTFRRARVL